MAQGVLLLNDNSRHAENPATQKRTFNDQEELVEVESRISSHEIKRITIASFARHFDLKASSYGIVPKVIHK